MTTPNPEDLKRAAELAAYSENTPEDLRTEYQRYAVAQARRIADLEAKLRELEAACAAMREGIEIAVSDENGLDGMETKRLLATDAGAAFLAEREAERTEAKAVKERAVEWIRGLRAEREADRRELMALRTLKEQFRNMAFWGADPAKTCDLDVALRAADEAGKRP